MGDEEETMTPAGRYLTQRMAALGFKTKAEVADTAGVARSTITRLFKRPEYRPDVDVMRRLARGLRVEHDELVAAIYGEAEAPAPPAAHPIVEEVARMLDPASPLTAESRSALVVLLDRVIEGHRLEMRGAVPAVYSEWGPVKVTVDHTSSWNLTRPASERETTGRRLYIQAKDYAAPTTDIPEYLKNLAAADSPLDPSDRDAIRDGMTSLARLGYSLLIVARAADGTTDPRRADLTHPTGVSRIDR